MERLKRRIEVANRALATFEEVVALQAPNAIERDAAIQRFEYTVEAVWKAARSALDERFGVNPASPKTVIRACAQNGLLSEDDARAAMVMIDDRNLTAHTYNEALAIALLGRLRGHAALLKRWLAAVADAT